MVIGGLTFVRESMGGNTSAWIARDAHRLCTWTLTDGDGQACEGAESPCVLTCYLECGNMEAERAYSRTFPTIHAAESYLRGGVAPVEGSNGWPSVFGN